MKFKRLLEGVGAYSIEGRCPADVTGVASDSREIREGNIFVAIPGSRHDGLDYAGEAVKRGASAIVCDRGIGTDHPICRIYVPDVRKAVAIIASNFYGKPSDSLKVTGITGTNGKTTVAHLMRRVLDDISFRPGLIGTVEYRIGQRVIPASRTTPESVKLQAMLRQMKDSLCDNVVMEVSSHALFQKRVYGIDFDVCVFTNLTRDHLDYHGSMDEYFNAKSILFESCGKSNKRAHAVINFDDKFGKKLFERSDINAEKISYGLAPGADVSAVDIELSQEGSKYTVQSPWGSARILSGLLGRFNIYNNLAAFAACGALGVGCEALERSLSGFNRMCGRLEPVDTGRDFKVFVDYAHTDDALRHVLVTLKEITPGRLIVIFGCGGDRDRGKRPAMAAIAGSLADKCVVTSDNPRSEEQSLIFEEIESGFDSHADYEIIYDREEAIVRGLELAGKGDVLLIAGKGHETFQQFENKTIPFDDRQIVRKHL